MGKRFQKCHVVHYPFLRAGGGPLLCSLPALVKPRAPRAAEWIFKSASSNLSSRHNTTPLKWLRNCSHTSKSSFISPVTHIKWWELAMPAVATATRAQNACPSANTQQAMLRCPIIDCSSQSVTFLAHIPLLSKPSSIWSLSCGVAICQSLCLVLFPSRSM